MNKVKLAFLLVCLGQMALTKSPLARRALSGVISHINNVPAVPHYTKEQMQKFYREDKVVKIYDLQIYSYLSKAGLTARPVDYIQAVLHTQGWVTIDIDSIVYAYPADQPPDKEKPTTELMSDKMDKNHEELMDKLNNLPTAIQQLIIMQTEK